MSEFIRSTGITDPEEFVRMPGLFCSWEVAQIIEPGASFLIEGAGTASDGTQLFAVYRREINGEGDQ